MRKYLMLPLVLITILAIAAPTYAEIPSMKLRWANYMPETIYWSKVDNFFAQQLEKRTGGKVQIKVFHGGALGSVLETPRLVGSGAVDIGNFPVSFVASQFPMQNVLIIPMLAMDDKTMIKLSKVFLSHPLIREESKRNNVHGFLVNALAPYHLIANKPLRTVEDLKGLKVRIHGPFVASVFSTLGMVPVNLPSPETYEGLQRGTIDGTFGNYSGFRLFKAHEVAKHLCDINFGAVGKYLTYINLDLWNKWPQELRDIFNQVNEEAEAYGQKLQDEAEEAAIAFYRSKADMQIHRFVDQEKMQAMLPDLVGEWVKQTTQMGYGENAKIMGDFVRQTIKDIGKAK